MSEKLQKLELTWPGKDERFNPEPRILLEDTSKSYSKEPTEEGSVKPTFDNMLIHGDNLLALKALEQDYTGKVKCIYIDPPYNTGSAFEYYDDGLEHSIWLSLMRDRLEILRKLLSEDGVIFVQLDDNEGAYLKVLMDEVFGRNNYINTICVKTKNSSGASGGGEDKRLKKNIEFIFVYSKGQDFCQFKTQYEEILLEKYIAESSSFAYKSVLYDEGKKEYYTSTVDGSGNEIKIFKHTNYIIKSISQISKEENISEIAAYKKYFDKIFTLENAQTSIRTRVKEATDEDDTYYTIEYYPISGRNKGQLTEVGFLGKTKRLVSYLKNTCIQHNNEIYKRIKIGTLWNDMSWSSVFFEGDVDFPSGKKPEKLVQRIIEMSTNEGDLVLDSFLGSGTTAAVAHKMGRKWIGIEMGDHCNTHCLKRLKNIIDGTDPTGITKMVEWKNGGSFKFYELASTLIVKDRYGQQVISDKYNADMLAEAMCKILDYHYQPDKEKYWKQGFSSEKSFIYTTTMSMQETSLEALAEEVGDNNLLICCSAFRGNANAYPNISVKKIPAAILKKCEWGATGYPFQLKDYQPKDEDFEFDEEE